MDDDAEEEFEEEEAAPDLDEEELDEDLEEDDLEVDGDLIEEVPVGDVVGLVEGDDEVDGEAVVPARRAAAGEDDDVEEEEDDDPDDVEEDLDTILKDRIASGDDLEDEEEDEVPDPRDPDVADGVTAKRDGEFTCHGCFMIVHPRQFGRKDRLACPVGDEDCPSVAVVRKQLG